MDGDQCWREQYRLRRDKHLMKQKAEDIETESICDVKGLWWQQSTADIKENRNVPVNTPQPSLQRPCNHKVPSFNDPIISQQPDELTIFILFSLYWTFSIYICRCHDVCRRCTNDKHIPKLYSPDQQQMDPCPVPPELTVSIINRIYIQGCEQVGTALNMPPEAVLFGYCIITSYMLSPSIVKAPGTSWEEPVLVWLTICMPTGSGKSILFRHIHSL